MLALSRLLWRPLLLFLQRPGARPRSPLLQALQDPARLRELSSPEGLPDELTGIVAQIQATNQRLRELENSYQAVDSSLLVLQVRLGMLRPLTARGAGWCR
jgi:hypothetical protein